MCIPLGVKYGLHTLLIKFVAVFTVPYLSSPICLASNCKSFFLEHSAELKEILSPNFQIQGSKTFLLPLSIL